MPQLTAAGADFVRELAERHGFSHDAVTEMLLAVMRGQGRMAQFGHPEFGGSGQWMQGGMLMIGDMFNSGLKYRVESLCQDIAQRVAQQPDWSPVGSFQSQNQGSAQYQGSGGATWSLGRSPWVEPEQGELWWPAELGTPNALGAQNNVGYAYFANARRLAVKTGSDVWLYDTLDHSIGGFSQQQGGGSSILFNSQYGVVNLASLPVIWRSSDGPYGSPSPTASAGSFSGTGNDASWNAGQGSGSESGVGESGVGESFAAAPSVTTGSSTQNISSAPPNAGQSGTVDLSILAALERLGVLKSQGVLTEEEFSAKKAELLQRL